MNAWRILIFGSQADLATPAAQALTSALKSREGLECVVRDKVPPPARGNQNHYQGAILVWKSADEAALTRWSQWLKGLPQAPRIAAFVEGKLSPKARELFAPVAVVNSVDALVESFLPAASNKSSDATVMQATEALPSATLSGLQPPPPPLPSLNNEAPSEQGIAELTLVDFEMESLPASGAMEHTSTGAGEALSIDIGMHAEPNSEPASILSGASEEEPLILSESIETPAVEASLATEASEELSIPQAVASEAAPDVSADDILGNFGEPEPVSFEASPQSSQGTGVPFDPDAEENSVAPLSDDVLGFAAPASANSSAEPVAGQGSAGELSLGGVWNESPAPEISPASESLSADPLADPLMSDVPKISSGPATDEVQTLRRYATLREREAREKEAALQALNRQMEQVRERLARSEAERRRLTLALDESEVGRRTLEDELEQTKHHLSKTESSHQEELRAFQLRLDNAQFQASKAEKKLEDFRERVRSDIQKIRVRERELANRLELQKRDAEALLAAKDERLLHQKRDIDRLEFELETLRERLLDQTQKAEDRVARLSRALKALKMAQGMLSGIEDEVLPNVDDKSDGGEEAA